MGPNDLGKTLNHLVQLPDVKDIKETKVFISPKRIQSIRYVKGSYLSITMNTDNERITYHGTEADAVYHYLRTRCGLLETPCDMEYLESLVKEETKDEPQS